MILRIGALVAALALAGSACTGANEEPQAGPEATASARPEATETAPEAGGEPTPPEEALPGRPGEDPFTPEDEVLTVAVKEPRTLDPMRIADPGAVLVARQLYEGLTRWDPERRRVVPAAARSWKVEDGGRRLVFRLRSNLTFHDGTPIKSKDFQFAFDRIALKKNASDLAFTLDQVKGFDAVNQVGKSKHLAGLRTPDARTLVFELTQPFAEFPAVLTHPALVPLPEKAVKRYDRFLSQPVGNGSFRIAEPWSGTGPVLLESFDRALSDPEIDGIRFIPYPDAANSWLPFLEGDVDVAEVPFGRIKAARERFGNEGYVPQLNGYYFGLNTKSAQLKDVRLRVAISRAIDREAIAENVFNETLAVARGIVPRGMPGFEQDICTHLCTYSPRAARRLVKQVPRRSRKVTIDYNKDRVQKRAVRMVKKDLEDVGLEVETKAYPFEKYLERLSDGELRMYRLGWIAEYPSPDVFMTSLFESNSPDNHSGFSSKRVDKLFRRAHKETSRKRRARLYLRAERLILSRMPVVPVGSFVMRWAAQDWVRDIDFDVTGGFDVAPVSIEGR